MLCPIGRNRMQICDTKDQNILAKNASVWLRNNLNYNDSIYHEQK
jgi:hypothetical protein